MQTIEMSGYKLYGPYRIDGDMEIPRSSGIYIILTRTADSRLRGVYISAAGNLREEIDNNPRKECWKRNEINGLSVWIHPTTGKTEAQRSQILFDIRESRPYSMPCRD